MIDVVSRTIPFIEHNDNTRNQLSASQCRQVVALNEPDIPYIRTGYEEEYLSYSSFIYEAKGSGSVAYKNDDIIIVKYDDPNLGGEIIDLGWEIKNYGGFDKRLLTNLNMNDPIVKDQIIARHVSVSPDKFLRLGKNLVTSFISHPYAFKDAIPISESCASKMAIRYVHEETMEFEDAIPIIWYNGKISYPQGTRVDKASIIFYTKNKNPLSTQNIVSSGNAIRAIASGKLYYKMIINEVIKTKNEEDYYEVMYQSDINEQQTIAAIIDYVYPTDTLRAEAYKRYYCPQLYTRRSGKSIILKYWIVEEIPIEKGCKLSNRHGNKGVCSIILPDDEMPTTMDGIHADIIVSPLSVTSRMNCGQLFENHLNSAMKKIFRKASAMERFDDRKNLIGTFLNYIQEPPITEMFMKNFNKSMWNNMVTNNGFQIIQRPFNCCTFDKLNDACKFAGMDPDLKEDVTMMGKTYRATIGNNYFFRLQHEPYLKLWGRSVGDYSSMGQPVKGSNAHRFGEMETWSGIGYEAQNILQELMSVKSDNLNEASRMLSYLHDGQEQLYSPHDKSCGAMKILQVYLHSAGYKLADDDISQTSINPIIDDHVDAPIYESDDMPTLKDTI